MIYYGAYEVLKNNKITPISNFSTTASILKIQSNASLDTFGFSLYGKMKDNFDFSKISVIKDNGMTLEDEIKDSSGYTADISGYREITIQTSGIVDDDSQVMFYLYSEN